MESNSGKRSCFAFNRSVGTKGVQIVQNAVGFRRLFEEEILIGLAVIVKPQPDHRKGLSAAAGKGQAGVPGQGSGDGAEGQVAGTGERGEIDSLGADVVLSGPARGTVILFGVVQGAAGDLRFQGKERHRRDLLHTQNARFL